MSTSFKKVVSAISVGAVLASTVGSSIVAAASGFLPFAEALADAKIITMQSTEAGYRLADNALRQEVVAMATALAKLTPADTCAGKFSDVSATKPNSWVCKVVEAALSNGLIAANASFRPEDKITRAEALAMILKGQGVEIPAVTASSFNDVKEGWQVNVAEVALSKKIISANASFRPNDLVTRGELFVMAANAAGLEIASDDLDLDDLFGDDEDDTTTSTGTTDTGDTGTVVKAGDLNVSLNPASSANGTQIPWTGSIRFAKVDFKAGSSDISLNSIELKSLGLAEVPSTTRIWFEKNGKRLSGKASFSSERLAVTSFAPALVVKAGATETLDLYVELSTSAGNDFQFAGKVVASSAANVVGEFITNTLRTANYTVAPVTFTAVTGLNSSVTQISDAIELARFTIENKDLSSETRDVQVQSITLRQLGTGDLADLADLQIERNGVKVSTEATVSGKDVTFLLNDIIKDGGTKATYYVKAKVISVENNGGDTYQFNLRNDSDLNTVEVLNGFRSTVTNASATASTYTITGADVTFTRDSSVELSKTYAKGSSDVIFMQGTITSKSAITLEDPTLTFNGTGSDLFTTLYLQIGSSTMTWSATATGTAQFSGLATVDGAATIKLYAKLKDTATAVDVKFDDLRLSSFDKVEYVSNQNTVSSSVGSIPWVQVTVGSTILSVTRVDGLGDTKVSVGSKAVLVNELSLAVTQGNDVNISNATYTITASGTYNNNVFATLYVDGAAVSTKTISGTTVTFSNLSKLVSKTAVKLAVKVDLSDAYSDGDYSMQLTSLDAVDTITSANVTVTAPTSANFTVAAAIGALSSSDNNPKASLLLAGAKDQKILAFRVKASNDSVRLRDVNFTWTGLANLSNFRILTPANTYLASTSSSGTAVVFSNIADTGNYVVAMDKTETFYLVADINTNVKGVSDLAVALDWSSTSADLTTSKVKASNGTLSGLVGADTTSNTHAIEENMAFVAKQTNTSKDIQTRALVFTVTASGKDSVTLSDATFDNTVVNYTGTWIVKVYKTSVSAANLLGAGSADTWVVSFYANQTVDAGSTNTYIVVIEGVTPSNTDANWTVRLSNMQVVSGTSVINSSSYNNMGEFPITETK